MSADKSYWMVPFLWRTTQPPLSDEERKGGAAAGYLEWEGTAGDVAS
jgi:hypothetical protein